MNTSSNTEKAFAAMKEVPVEISTDAVRNIVMTTAVASVTVSKASIIAKLIKTKLHLNSIIAMTSFLSASIVGSVLLFSGLHSDRSKTDFTPNIPEHPEIAFNGNRPDISLGVDTPQKSKQVVIVNNGQTRSVNDSGKVIIINDDGHGRTMTRVIVLDSSEMANMRLRSDSMPAMHQMTQTYTYTIDDGHKHKHGRGKNSNYVVINESRSFNDADIAMADANIALADADIARADAELARNDSALNAASCSLAYAYSNSMPMSMSRNGKCVIVTDMNAMNLDSLPPLDGAMTIISNSGVENVHGNKHVVIIKQGPGPSGNDAANQMVIVNDGGPQIMLDDNGGMMHSDSLVQKLSEKLFADKLITDQKHFTFIIDGSKMKVNNSKQDDAIYQQYKTFIETVSPNKVDKKFLYDLTVNGDQMKITVHNYNN